MEPIGFALFRPDPLVPPSYYLDWPLLLFFSFLPVYLLGTQCLSSITASHLVHHDQISSTRVSSSSSSACTPFISLDSNVK